MVDAFAIIKHKPKNITIIGTNKDKIIDRCIKMFTIIKTTPSTVIINPAHINIFKSKYLDNCADTIEPTNNPIGGNKLAYPYSELLIPLSLIAIKGAKATTT